MLADAVQNGPMLRVGVLALQGAFEAHAVRLRELGAEAVLVRAPEQLAGLDGLIIPGGESTTFLNHLQRGGFFEVLREFVSVKPTFGTCAGAILLAKQVHNPEQDSLRAMNIAVERNAYGRQNESHIQQTETELPGGPLEMVYIRAPRIEALAPGVKVLAERGGSPTLVREEHLLAASFHPELSPDTRVHQFFLDMVRERR